MEPVAAVSVEGRALAQGTAAGRRSLRVPRSRVGVLFHGGVVLWGALFAAGTLLEQHFFLLRRYDLGNFTQAVWSTAHGHFLQVTEVGGEQVSRLGIHVDPIILGLVPLWWIWSSPDLLLVVQVTALAAGALPLYWLGRKHLQSARDAALISTAYLFSPAIAWNALHEFDAVALSVPLLLACVWFLDESRLWAFAAVALLAVLCQEQIGLIVACLGAVYGWRTRRLMPAAAIAAVGIAVTFADLHLILPHFSDGSPYQARFSGVGGSVGGAFATAVSHPLRIADRVFSPVHLLGLALLLVPVLAMCFRSVIFLAAAPQLAFVLLSARVTGLAPTSQNILPIVPFIFAGTVYALRPRSEPRKWEAGHVLVASLACTAFFGPLNPLLLPRASSDRAAAERRAVALVPAGAPVSATNYLGAHLAARSYLGVFPVVGKAKWLVLDRRDAYLPDLKWLRSRHGNAVGVTDLVWQPKLMTAEIRKLEASPRWRRVYSRDGVMVFTRRRS
jgi:uncharacterized membrane protein